MCTLTAAESRVDVIELTGVLTGNINVVVPDGAAFWSLYNNTSGDFTITLKTSAGTGIVLPRGRRVIAIADGTNVSGERAHTSLLSKSVAGSSNVTLTNEESANDILEFTGIITGNINVVVDKSVRQWTVFNNTTGAFTLTVKTTAGTGIVVGTAKRAILYADGTNVVRVTADL